MLGRSFMYSKKSSGPSTDPWGTPHVMDFSSEEELLQKVYCVLPFRYDENHSGSYLGLHSALIFLLGCRD